MRVLLSVATSLRRVRTSGMRLKDEPFNAITGWPDVGSR